MARKDDVLVRFQQVTKTYDGEYSIVRNLDLDIRRGEFLTLLGPSGSGKTTCLMMLAGFEFPTGGEIWLEGTLLNKLPPHKRNIGMVFQNYALFPHMTVAQNVEYPLRTRGIDKATRAKEVENALHMVQMENFAARYPSQLSGGQQQRVALSRALVFQPKLVLMDEPLGALDKQLRKHMQLELKALHQRLGVTFVYVTHDQDEALTMSDRVAVLDQGVIQQLDAVDRLYEAPTNRFVAGFVGDNNSFNAMIESERGDSCQVRLTDGSVLIGLNVNKGSLGDKVMAYVRPERIRFADERHSEQNVLPATVVDVVYFGDHVRVSCAVAQQANCFVKVPFGQGMAAPPAIGNKVKLTFTTEHLRIFT
ncbi:MAG: ABC transporter ATP-binding protein [Gammaproteobacteria bacterium]|nr:ABC transporter ATP-binding protein [Gammaproteobacteria bacterium]